MFKKVILFAALPLTLGAQTSPTNSLTASLRESYQNMRLCLAKSAELMNERDYEFKLTPVSRTFASWVQHTAEMNYTACSKIRGMARPDLKPVESAAKEQLVEILQQSFEFCDPVFLRLNDQKLLTEISLDTRQLYPVTELVGLTNSLHEHYGNLIGYLRSKRHYSAVTRFAPRR
jgi:hypothetical protein